jgi:hypothetical protein
MGVIRTTLRLGVLGVTGGVASIGAGLGYLTANTTLVDLQKEDPWFKTKVYTKHNPKGNPALIDDCIKRVPLSKIRPDLRDNEALLTLEFCRGIWSRWGMLCPGLTIWPFPRDLQSTHSNSTRLTPALHCLMLPHVASPKSFPRLRPGATHADHVFQVSGPRASSMSATTPPRAPSTTSGRRRSSPSTSLRRG